MTRRRWIADEWNETRAVLRDAQAAHLARVLRAAVGQEFDIVAGDKVRRGIVASIGENEVEFSLLEKIDAPATLPLIVGLSVIRFERMEWAIEKLTELGAARVVPLAAQRSDKHLVQASAKRVERWRRIARESAQQSRRADVPEIADPISPVEWAKENLDGWRLLISEHEQARSLRDSLEAHGRSPAGPNRIYAAIGPEGGWTDTELAEFAEHGWEAVSLGSRILRAETAAVFVASVVNAWV